MPAPRSAGFACYPQAIYSETAVMNDADVSPSSLPKTRPDLADAFYPVVIVGAGQAGLSMSYLLKQQGINHVILEGERLGHAWREQRWDTFCLVTPNWQCTLPGFPYDGDDPEGFMKRDEIVAYLERYRAHFAPPICEGVKVVEVSPDLGLSAAARVAADAGARYRIVSSQGTVYAAQIVVATGGYHDPLVPPIAAALSADIIQLNAVDYRNPSSLPEGAVLVVGTGQSGCQLAEDLHLAGRTVHLCVGDAPRVARRYRGKDVVEWLDLMGYYDMPVDKHPLGTGVREKTNHYVTGRDGGHDIDLRQFAREGMHLHGRLNDIRDGTARFDTRLAEYLDNADAVSESIKNSIDQFIDKSGLEAPSEAPYAPVWQPEPSQLGAPLDLKAAGITSVLWCIGFRSNYRWMALPIFDERGYPKHERGITSAEGVYFLGLSWQYSWGSGRFSGVARDAQYLLEAITSALAKSSAGEAVLLNAEGEGRAEMARST